MANLSNINGKFVVEQTTGYVGVGTEDPNYPIEVLNASAEIALNASGASIYRLRSDSTDAFRINKNGVGDRLVIAGDGVTTVYNDFTIDNSSPEFYMTTGSTHHNWRVAAQEVVNEGFEIASQPAAGGAYTNHLVILGTSGKVGIGVALPSVKFNVVGDSGTAVVESIRNPSTSWGEYALTRYGTEGADFRYMDFGYYRGTSEGTRGLVIKSQANATLATFLDSGDVGIGITSPSEKFEVTGTVASITSSFPTFKVQGSDVNYQARMRWDTNNNVLEFLTRHAGTYYSDTLVLKEGKVGINTNSPGQKLAIEGSGTADENVLRVNNQANVSSRIWLRNSAQSGYIFNSGGTADTLASGIASQGFGMGINNNSPIQFYNGLSASVKLSIDYDGVANFTGPVIAGTTSDYTDGVGAVVGNSPADDNGGIVDVHANGNHRYYTRIAHGATGSGSAGYWHVKTNMKPSDSVMFLAKFYGYISVQKLHDCH